ncbi:hypothetical protein SAMN05216375_102141 [Trichococcus ilyis]|uniref:Uncharacterized protein n=1 Tax=Trichococcus ilyis TaxID=640938 RepID=A0A143YG22_9LACT|nr:Hypothetical protein TR210_665 [Trichococcus ilyis]SEI67384.1 hypothetical protein SAMN05216375_102141 [Trichococcus ilyis]
MGDWVLCSGEAPLRRSSSVTFSRTSDEALVIGEGSFKYIPNSGEASARRSKTKNRQTLNYQVGGFLLIYLM